MRFNFIGSSFANRSKSADIQRTINLYVEPLESGQGKNAMALLGTPGLSAWSTLSDGPVRMLTYDEQRDRVLAVGKDRLYSIDSAGVSTDLGEIPTQTTVDTPVGMAFNRTEFLLVAERKGYILNNVALTPIADADFPTNAGKPSFLDGYFIVPDLTTQDFYISGLLNGTSWAALDFGAAEEDPDNVVGNFADHGQLWLFGSQKTEVFFNSGNADFPFERIPHAIIEEGMDAEYSVAKAGGTVMWLGGSSRGRGVVYAASGYVPTRVSNHAVEFAIQNMTTTSDARAFTYQEDGHEFYVLSFPTEDETWVLDLTTGQWHERGYWNAPQGRYNAHRAINHVHAFGKHLVGDRNNGKIYEQSLELLDDDGDAKRWERIGPYISNEEKWVNHHYVQFDMEVGVGLPTGQGSDPKCMMSYTDDSGRTWSNERQGSMGKIGEYQTRVKFNRLGRSRNRAYRLAGSEPVKTAIVDAYLSITGGHG